MTMKKNSLCRVALLLAVSGLLSACFGTTVVPAGPVAPVVPQVPPEADFSHLMREMTRKGLGASAIADAEGTLLGIFTDGDLRRLVETGRDLRALTARDVMHANPRAIRDDALAAEAAEAMEKHRVNVLLVLDAQERLTGALNSNDLMRAKVI